VVVRVPSADKEDSTVKARIGMVSMAVVTLTVLGAGPALAEGAYNLSGGAYSPSTP
jgi:hypothetical protein